ncbi:putative F-box protein At1g47790 [Solanum verrucosum]|uniref:putative F-box protein At1g47790 n=1 Tax=Solanum verrucosum TaxID=315347 RepID=UPI0020D15032|nr:putative F-box protein At1g47790 [Solanum verrucosum]
MTQKKMKSVRGTLANREATPKAAMMKISNSNTTKGNQISDSKKFNLSRCQQKKKKKSIANTTRITIAKSSMFPDANNRRRRRIRNQFILAKGSIFSQQDLMWEILSRLPVRSLLRFKCVAKSWDITSDPYFQMKHQRHHANSTKFLVVHCNLNRDHNFYSTSSLSSPDDVQKLDDLPPKSHILFGSCHGLFLIGVGSSNNQVLLWNPSTRESILLPPPEFGILNSYFALGYDQTTNDYVVLTIHDDMTLTPVDPHCGILALKSASWRKVCIKTPTLFCPCRDSFGTCMVFIHGAFHWLPCGFLVVSLSISNQTLTEIPFPDQMCNRQPPNLGIKQCSLSVLEGMLCISSSWRRIDGEDTTFMLWAMKDYGVKESWIQLFKINFTGLDLAKSIYRFPDGDVLFDVYTSGEGGFCRSLRTSKGPIQLWFDWFHSFYEYSTIFDVTTFTESLISPKSLL